MNLKSFLLRNLVKQCKVTYFTPVFAKRHYYERSNGSRERWITKRNTAAVILGSVLIGSATADKNIDTNKANNIEAGDKRPDLPTFRAEEISEHDNKESFWVTYRHGVYDVTSFIPSHPGGEQILNAAGLSIEPFWNVYGMHKTQEVFQLLESYRIGNLHDDDIVDHSDEELWVKEPYRDQRLVVKTAKPFNAEVPPELQVEHFNTPNELFYVRQHMPVPDIDASTHKLTVYIEGTNQVTKEFTLEDLNQFPTVTLNAALMCAGNRRSEMNQVQPVKGLSWGGGAISNASWRGVLLRDLLLHCGLDDDCDDDLHVILSGADIDATGEHFSTSIPLRVALDRNAQVLLATRMNGAALPPDHGRPLRAVVPGAPAVRSVKWLQSITVSKNESSSHWHKKDYRAFNPSVTWESADFGRAPPLYSLPVTAAACLPRHGDAVAAAAGAIHVKGYAYSGGGASIMRVDISSDQGRSWHEASLQRDTSPPPRHYAWTLWTIDVPVDPNADEVEIWVKATDSNFNTQPENFDHIWNLRGLLSNAYHKIKVYVKH